MNPNFVDCLKVWSYVSLGCGNVSSSNCDIIMFDFVVNYSGNIREYNRVQWDVLIHQLVAKGKCRHNVIGVSGKQFQQCWYFLYFFCSNVMSWHYSTIPETGPRGSFKNTNELLSLTTLKFSPVNKIHIFQCMGKKFHTKYLSHALKDMILIQNWNFKSS